MDRLSAGEAVRLFNLFMILGLVSCIKVLPPVSDVTVTCPKVECPKPDQSLFSAYAGELSSKVAECQKNLKDLSKDFADTLQRNSYLEDQAPNCPQPYCPQGDE